MAHHKAALPLPFGLPLVATRIPSQVLQFIPAGLGPRFDESSLDKKTQENCVERWEDIIRDKERATLEWMKQWLDCCSPLYPRSLVRYPVCRRAGYPPPVLAL